MIDIAVPINAGTVTGIWGLIEAYSWVTKNVISQIVVV
jgi:hypothetical protein